MKRFACGGASRLSCGRASGARGGSGSRGGRFGELGAALVGHVDHGAADLDIAEFAAALGAHRVLALEGREIAFALAADSDVVTLTDATFDAESTFASCGAVVFVVDAQDDPSDAVSRLARTAQARWMGARVGGGSDRVHLPHRLRGE